MKWVSTREGGNAPLDLSSGGKSGAPGAVGEIKCCAPVVLWYNNGATVDTDRKRQQWSNMRPNDVVLVLKPRQVSR